MAYCSKCGEKMEEIIIYTPKTCKEKGREFRCPTHGLDKNVTHQVTGRTNPGNKAGRDWGFILGG